MAGFAHCTTSGKKYQLSKYFGGGRGHVVRYRDSEILLFYWSGKEDGAARYVAHVKRYTRERKEFASLAALLRSVEAEHEMPKLTELEECTAGDWLARGTIKETSRGEENTYYRDEFENQFYCKNYPR